MHEWDASYRVQIVSYIDNAHEQFDTFFECSGGSSVTTSHIHIRSGDVARLLAYAADSRVENGTGKSRPDRLRLPFKPTVNRFREKNGKMGKQNGKTGGNGNGNGWGVFPTVFTVPVFSRENSRGNSRICRSRLCYLCWKRELLFACVPT